MNLKKLTALVLALVMALTLFGCGKQQDDVQQNDPQQPETVTVTDMIGREVAVTPGSYQRVVCIGAGALRMYSYIADTALLCGVEDIDNTTLAERPKMFDAVARPYVLAYGDVFAALPSCGVGGPTAQAAEAEKILSCQPDIIVSEYEDVEKADALQQQVGVPVITLRAGADGVFAEAFPGVLGRAAPGVSASRPGNLAGAPSEALPIPFGEAFPEGMPNQEQEQEQRRKGGRGTRAGGAIRDGEAGAFPSGGRGAPGGAFACAGSVSPDGSPRDGAPADGRLPGEYPSGERPQGGGVAAGMPLPDGRLPCGARSASHPFPHQAPYPAGHPAPQRAERPFPSSGSFPGGPLLEGHPQREGFLSCWSAYPVQQGREDAWREWLRLWERRALPEPCAVREAIRLMLAEDTRWRRGKIPKMAKWLAGMGWNDRPFVEPEGCAGAGRPRVGTAARRAQDNDDMAKMLLQVRRAHAQSGLYASNAGQSGAALPAGGQDARAAADSGGGLGGGSCGVPA